MACSLFPTPYRRRRNAIGSGVGVPPTVPAKVAAEIQAVLDAVAEAPPPAFSGGGKWEAMHGEPELAGIYEIRVQGAGMNHRLFCLVQRNSDDLGGPSIVAIGGLTKPKRSDADSRTTPEF